MKQYDNYKDSGIEWIGEIPEHWASIKLKYVLSIQSGKGITNEQFVENGEFEIYGGNGVLGKTDSYTNDGLDIIIGRVGALCGNIRLVDGKKWISDNALLANTTQNNYFIEKCLKVLDLNRLANKNAQPLITGTMVKDQYIGLPPLEEQTQIANYLDHKTTQIDTLISKKQQLITLLQEERIAVINQAVTKGLDPNVQLKDSGIEWLGEIPEHWKVKKLRFLADIIPSGIDKKFKENEQEVLLCNYVDVYKNDFITSNMDFMKATASVSQIKKLTLQKYDVIATKDSEDPNDIGVPALVLEDMKGIVCGYHLTVFRPLENHQIGRFLFWFFKSKMCSQYFSTLARGITRYALGSSAFKNLTVSIPFDINEIQEISNYLELKTIEIDTIIVKTKQEIELLKEYKTALISEVVTGKVDVRELVLN